MLRLFVRLWRGWKKLSHRLIAGQNWLLMSLVYWVSLAPVAVWMRLSGKKLFLRDAKPPASSYWTEHGEEFTMERGTHLY